MSIIKTISFAGEKIIFFLHKEGEYISDLIRRDSMFYEIDHLELLNYLPINNSGIFVDIGANIGNHTLYFAKVMQKEVYSFEPIEENFRLLKRNIIGNDLEKSVKLFNMALSNKQKNISMRQNVKNNFGTWSLEKEKGSIFCDTLDSMITNVPIAYMKLDVEGEELRVLQGAQNIINTYKPMISAEYHYGIEFKKIQNFLVARGYHNALFLAGRSSNAIFIHASVMNLTQLTAIQNFVLQLQSQNSLNIQANSMLSIKNNPYENLKQKIENKVDNFSITEIDKNKLIEKSYEIDRKRDNSSHRSMILEPSEVANSIEVALPSDATHVVFNFTEQIIDSFSSISIGQDGVISVNDKEVFSKKISLKILKDVMRSIMLNNVQRSFLIVVDFDEEQLDLAQEFNELQNIQYGIIVSKVPHLHWEKWTWLSNAKFILSQDDELYAEFRKKFIFNINHVKEIRLDKKDFMPFEAKVEISKKTKKKGLLISYFFTPAMSVGVFRPEYWFRNMQNLSHGEIHIEVATAMNQQDSEVNNIHYIPDYGSATSLLVEPEIKQEHESIKNSVNTIALSWRKNLEEYFDTHPQYEYDFIILTGNPFMHFDFSDYAKKKWGATVIQDYRDPMGNNPRLAKKTEKMRKKYEDIFCFKANSVITVNKYCAKHMSPLSPTPIEIIGNGYNDQIIENIALNTFPDILDKYHHIVFKSSLYKNLIYLFKKNKKRSINKRVIRLAYAGTFYKTLSPLPLVNSIRNVLGYEFHHFGNPEVIISKSNNKRLILHGKKSYNETIANLMHIDIGVVYNFHDFESTTKIYDYIACDMVILIITSPENPKPYTLSKELEGLEYVYWVVNTEEEIIDFLTKTTFPENIKRPQREQFSRKEGTKKLINLIKRKTDG